MISADNTAETQGAQDTGAATKPKAGIAFVACALVLMLLPLAGMMWARTDATTENRDLAQAPSLQKADGTLNADILADAGTYFEDHFAFRNYLVDANAHLRSAIGDSATDQVIVGKDGWLYYGGTLADYVGAQPLTDRQLANIAHNLALFQGYVQAQGATFAFCVPPNKNTLYGNTMPAHYLHTPARSNYERLAPLLEKAGITTVDLPGILGARAEAGERLYCYRDTHWTNEGALIGANALLEHAGVHSLNIDEDAWTIRNDLVGDVAGMLYPAFPGTEQEAYAADINDDTGLTGSAWSFTEGAAVTDDSLSTRSHIPQTARSGPQALMMYRDSFGNALIPYLSSAFSQATYSKLVPYDASAVNRTEADTVIVERAERHLGYLAEEPFIMPAPRTRSNSLPQGWDAQDLPELGASLSVEQDGSYVVLEGFADAACAALQEVPDHADARFSVAVTLTSKTGQTAETAVYEAFSLSGEDPRNAVRNDWGYSVHIPRATLTADNATECDATVQVLLTCNDAVVGTTVFPHTALL